MVRVMFETNGNDWHGTTAERLWATPVGISLYRLENSPFCAYDVSYQDVVVAREDRDGTLRFERVESRGGHSTYRILLKSSSKKCNFETYWRPIELMGCSYESSTDPETVFSVDVPARADIYEVYSLLEHGERDGVWTFEEAHCGHPLRD
jgi:hypothetical protein